MHVPFIASWLARIPAGSTYKKHVITMDIARAAVEIAGDALAEPAMEGTNLIPFELNENSGALHKAHFWRDGDDTRWSILSSEHDKWVHDSPNGAIKSLHLPADISESNNLVSGKQELDN